MSPVSEELVCTLGTFQLYQAHNNGEVWLCRKHPSGSYVTMRLATREDGCCFGMIIIQPCADLVEKMKEGR